MQIAVEGGTDDVRAYDDAEARDIAAGCVLDPTDPEAGFNPPDCKTTLSFTHPVTGVTLRALKVGDFPIAFDLVKRLNLLKYRFERLDACASDMAADDVLDNDDEYCNCIDNIGSGRDGGDLVQTCVADYVSVKPGTTASVPALSGLTNLARLNVTCTEQDLQNRRDSARESVDNLVDYVNDLRTYNKLITKF
jgi:hypothetical protein